MTIENLSLGSIAATVPMATNVFRKYNLDFCCGGKKSLKDACAERGIPLSEIKTQLESLKRDSGERPTDLPVRGMTAFIEQRYHQDLRTRLPELIALAQKVEKAIQLTGHF